ncbi:helix-turn-helix domain-containing protein [Mucilaginibacter sp. 3215]|uniref:helix-turn-helix domain-containing protein n=1 Tax=Mucilaginibacter sp. 3215 TaxID=3373912 RepID=UPI003D1D7C92
MKKTLYSQKYKTLITELTQLRIDAGLRQEDLAKRLSVPQSFISKYENGERRLDLIEVIEICNCLNSSVQTIIDKIKIISE